jgi:hypothetical protein
MAEVEGLSELVAAGGVHSTSPAKRITDGETHWFIGYAAPAPAEMVALRETETLRLVFRKEDILEVRRHGERFLVRARDGANMLASFEQVIKAAPTCGCGDGRNGGMKQGALARAADVLLVNISNCVIRIECSTIDLPFLGPTRVCIPVSIDCTPERTTDAQPS